MKLPTALGSLHISKGKELISGRGWIFDTLMFSNYCITWGMWAVTSFVGGEAPVSFFEPPPPP